MDYRTNTNVAKILACFLIALVMIETVSAAPLLEKKGQTNRPRNRNGTKSPKGKGKNPELKNLSTNTTNTPNITQIMFSKTDEDMWRNPCNAAGETTPDYSINDFDNNEIEQNINATRNSIKLKVQSIKELIKEQHANNASEWDTTDWERFHNETYSMLPTHPSRGGLPQDKFFKESKNESGVARKWHYITQIYVAGFLRVYNLHKEDNEENDESKYMLSQELKDLMEQAQELLCVIEHFVNATSNKDSKRKPKLITHEQMSSIITFNATNLKLHRLFIKNRFEIYINRLYDRVKNLNLNKNLEQKSIKRIKNTKTTRKPQHKKGGRRRMRTTTEPYTGEPTTTDIAMSKKVHIYRTRRPGMGEKHANKTANQHKKKNHGKKNKNKKPQQ